MKSIPKWQQDLVLARLERGEQYPETLLDWDEVSKQLTSGHTKRKSDIKDLRKRLTKF